MARAAKVLNKAGQLAAELVERRKGIAKLADDFLPKPRMLHPWPYVRFAVTHPRWEPSA